MTCRRPVFYLCIFFHVCSLMFSFTSSVHRVPLVCVSSVDVLRLNSQDDSCSWCCECFAVSYRSLITKLTLSQFVHHWHWYLCDQCRWLTCTCYHCDGLRDIEFFRDWERTSSSVSSLGAMTSPLHKQADLQLFNLRSSMKVCTPIQYIFCDIFCITCTATEVMFRHIDEEQTTSRCVSQVLGKQEIWQVRKFVFIYFVELRVSPGKLMMEAVISESLVAWFVPPLG